MDLRDEQGFMALEHSRDGYSDQLIIMVLHQGYWENEASFYCISFCAKKKGILSMIFLLTVSDLVSLHCALTNDTTHIFLLINNCFYLIFKPFMLCAVCLVFVTQ